VRRRQAVHQRLRAKVQQQVRLRLRIMGEGYAGRIK
jgi:hypothetical protein